jgi:putative aldouronate transport system permease protein
MALANMGKLKKQKKEKYGVSWRKDFRKNWSLYLLGLPVIAYFAIFHYLPMYGVIIAFKDFNMRAGMSFFQSTIQSDWVGMKHFIDFFNSYYFWTILRNTLVISISTLVFSFPIPIIFALLINEIKNNKFSSFVKTISYLPHFISLVVICGMVKQFVDQNGIVTQLLSTFGVANQNMLNNPDYFVPIYVISNIWQTLGWDSIIYIAAIAGVDMELYEAAKIDGANRWKQTIHITVPSILPTIILLLIMQVGKILNVGYEKIILLYNPVTYETADVISSFVYRKGLIDGSWSYSTAVGIFTSVINLILLCTSNFISKRVSETSLW